MSEKKQPRKRPNKYEKKLKVEATFDEVVKLIFTPSKDKK